MSKIPYFSNKTPVYYSKSGKFSSLIIFTINRRRHFDDIFFVYLSLSILIAGLNPDKRARLKEAIKSVLFKGTVQIAHALPQALEMLRGTESFQVMILPSALGKDKLAEFGKQLQELGLKNPPKIVVALQSSDKDSPYISQLFLAGFHGFICEPYSPEDLRRTLETIKETPASSDESGSRDKKVAMFLLADMMRHIDLVALDIMKGNSTRGYAGKELREVAKSFQQAMAKIPDDDRVTMITEKFSQAKPFADRAGQHKSAKARLIASHPGVEVRQVMQKRGISKERLLPLLKLEAEEFTAILELRTPITEASAKELARVLGESSRYWLGLQKKFDDYTAQQKRLEEPTPSAR